MAKIYSKNTWVNEVLANVAKYLVKNDVGVTVYSAADIALSTEVLTAGTLVNAAKMNNIEEGIDGLDTIVAGIEIPPTTAQNDFQVGSGAGAWIKKTLAEALAILGKAAVNGLASLNGSSLVVQNPADATATPTVSKIPIADAGGKLVAGWGGSANTLATLDASALVVQEPASKGVASGLASLNTSSKVVQDPANATATPTASKIPIADGSGKLDDWVTTKLANIVEDTTPELGGNLDLMQFSLKLPTGEPTSNLTAVGIIVTATVDTNAEGIGAPLALAADGNYDTADANSVNNMPCIALALETNAGSKKILLFGKIRNDAWNWTLGAGAANLIYVSTTVGTLTQTKPTGVDDVVQPIGYALSDDSMFFNPSILWITHTG